MLYGREHTGFRLTCTPGCLGLHAQHWHRARQGRGGCSCSTALRKAGTELATCLRPCRQTPRMLGRACTLGEQTAAATTDPCRGLGWRGGRHDSWARPHTQDPPARCRACHCWQCTPGGWGQGESEAGRGAGCSSMGNAVAAGVVVRWTAACAWHSRSRCQKYRPVVLLPTNAG